MLYVASHDRSRAYVITFRLTMIAEIENIEYTNEVYKQL